LLIAISAVIGFVAGSLPFSVWLVRWITHGDVREVGDGNPGAINAGRAGGWRAGVLVLVLDAAKGGLPVILARFVFALDSWALIPVVLSPVLGHAVSPWLRFRGGKGIAATFGVWSALTYWVVPTTLGGFMSAIMAVQSVNAWTVVMASVFTLIVLGLIHAETPLIVAFALNLALLVFTHRRGLLSTPKWRGSSGKKKEAQN